MGRQDYNWWTSCLQVEKYQLTYDKSMSTFFYTTTLTLLIMGYLMYVNPISGGEGLFGAPSDSNFNNFLTTNARDFKLSVPS